MSSFNIDLIESKVRIVVFRVLYFSVIQRESFAKIQIIDTERNVHTISSLDVPCSIEELKKTQKGSIFTLHKKERIDSVRLSHPEESTVEINNDMYTWICPCGKADEVAPGILNEVDSVGAGTKELIQRVLDAHKEANPDCTLEEKIEILDNTGRKRGIIGIMLKKEPA